MSAPRRSLPALALLVAAALPLGAQPNPFRFDLGRHRSAEVLLSSPAGATPATRMRVLATPASVSLATTVAVPSGPPQETWGVMHADRMVGGGSAGTLTEELRLSRRMAEAYDRLDPAARRRVLAVLAKLGAAQWNAMGVVNPRAFLPGGERRVIAGQPCVVITRTAGRACYAVDAPSLFLSMEGTRSPSMVATRVAFDGPVPRDAYTTPMGRPVQRQPWTVDPWLADRWLDGHKGVYQAPTPDQLVPWLMQWLADPATGRRYGVK